MATPVRSVPGTSETNALEMVPEQHLPLSTVPSSVVPTFFDTISNIGPHCSTTINTLAQKTIILDDVFES
jgi:hypothetical protein